MIATEFTVGGVLRQTFRFIGRHVGDFAPATGLLVFLPTLLNTAVATGAVRAAGSAPRLSSLGLAASLLVALLSLALFGIVIRAALGDFRGEPRSLTRDAGAALRLFVPNLVIGLLFYVAVAFAYALLIVPGIMLQCAWYVALPAYMAERPGLFGAFGRSRAMTKGHRWPIVGLLLIYGAAFALVGGTNYLVTLSLARGGVDGVGPWAFRIVIAALSAALNLFGSAAPAVAYVELLRAKGGRLSSDLVEAFS